MFTIFGVFALPLAQAAPPSNSVQPAGAANATKVVSQLADGQIVLHARDAQTHGATIRYEPQPQKNTIGYWTKAEDWVSWDLDVIAPGAFSVEILQGCGQGSGGSEVDFAFDTQVLSTVVQDTGGFQNFVTRDIGQVRFDKAGRYTLSVKAKKKPGLAVMDLRSVTLRPVPAAAK